MHQGHQNHHQQPAVVPASIEEAQVVNPVQQPTASPQNHTLHGNHHQLNTLALLAQALGPYAAQASSLNTPGSRPPGGRTESLYNPPTGGSGSTNAAGRSMDEDEHVGSFGTLMLSKRGRSKYLGPTAGSEWLNEVCSLSMNIQDILIFVAVVGNTRRIRDTVGNPCTFASTAARLRLFTDYP